MGRFSQVTGSVTPSSAFPLAIGGRRSGFGAWSMSTISRTGGTGPLAGQVISPTPRASIRPLMGSRRVGQITSSPRRQQPRAVIGHQLGTQRDQLPAPAPICRVPACPADQRRTPIATATVVACRIVSPGRMAGG
ncbi:hypothetical protein [Roseovarius pacificus]|uniref:hypothetical protein n=1 Tax=Roseovarius pacificus TaxID=337701 RepID=UPI002A18E744|nr:hypothetical protein [Roseovarius pacificus]